MTIIIFTRGFYFFFRSTRSREEEDFGRRDMMRKGMGV